MHRAVTYSTVIPLPMAAAARPGPGSDILKRQRAEKGDRFIFKHRLSPATVRGFFYLPASETGRRSPLNFTF